mmetsp:Transcript_4701/g.3958  ORF Transcript_4701/g.3958 Transcript_4701/m.3958 type:complete len:115 (-) Transcript_4701:79-423(-)
MLIGKQSVDINQLTIRNRAYDLSNKENFKNMNYAFEKVAHMSNERNKVTNELDNILKRKKSLKTSNSFQQLSEFKIHNMKRSEDSLNRSYIYNHVDTIGDARLFNKSYSDARIA